ncbi:MAG: hypothetical protein AAF479_06785 [Pseudomonadota bacterium]
MFGHLKGDTTQPSIELDWTFGYAMALLTTGLFLGASFIAFSYGAVPPMVSGTIAMIYAVLAALSAMVMIVGGGGMAALSYFLIGTALFYGMGTYFSVTVTRSSLFFSEGQQWQMLPQVNLVNALAIFCAVLAAGLLCARRPKGSDDMPSMSARLETTRPVFTPTLIGGLLIIFLEWMTFPYITNATVASLFSVLNGLPIFALFLGGALWSRASRIQHIAMIILFLAVFLEGLLNASKLSTIMPILALSFGFWSGERHRIIAVLMAVLTVWLYVAMLSSFVPHVRGHILYDPVNNSVADRITILSDTINTLDERAIEETEQGTLARFSPTQFSAHFIASYDNNFPGDSLDTYLVVLVPRILWPEKPVINPGKEFDSVWRDWDIMSSLAIGFPAEAYWNGGWSTVAIVGAYIGLVLGWFSRKWFLFRRDGWIHGGIFILSPVLVKSATWVESNIVGAYIGGWVKYILIIMAIDYAIRAFFYLRQRISEEFDDPLPVDMTPRAIGV